MHEANSDVYLPIGLLAFGVATLTGGLSAQQAVKHLNPVIEKLAAGKPFIGFQTGDLSLENARTVVRADIDYLYLEMEHGPMDFTVGKRGEEVHVPAEMLSQYVGTYESPVVAAGVKVSMDGSRLMIDTGEGKVTLFAHAENSFTM